MMLTKQQVVKALEFIISEAEILDDQAIKDEADAILEKVRPLTVLGMHNRYPDLEPRFEKITELATKDDSQVRAYSPLLDALYEVRLTMECETI